MTALLIAYFIGLYIRPQDWVPGVIGLPIDYMIFGVFIIAFFININAYQKIFKINMTRLFAVWLGVIVFSNLVHFEFDMVIDRFIYFFKFFIVFICLIAFINTERQYRFLIIFIIFLTAILAFQCVDMINKGVGWAGQELGWDGGYGGRAKWVGLWNGMNVLSLLFVTAFPFLIQFTLGPWSMLSKVISIGCMALIFKGVLLTQSRGGFISLMIVIAVSMALKMKLKYVIVLGVILLPIVLGIVSGGRLGEMNDPYKSSYNRVRVWVDGLEMFKSNPVTGVGKGMFIRNASVRIIAHNSFVENFAETGLIGLFVFILLFYTSLQNLYTLKMATEDLQVKSMATALICSLIGYAATSMFITTEFDLLYVLFGLSTSYCYMHNEFAILKKKDYYLVAGLAISFVCAVQVFVMFYMR